MKKYILLIEGTNVVAEIIPEINPDIPEFPLNERYPESFIEQLIEIDESVPVDQNWIYDYETKTFSEPVIEIPIIEEME